MALEATTGWRFVVEELERIGAEVHLAEPAEASALKGKKKRAKTDWADARHLRELLLIGRLPESWIPPAHLLDLRARVRTRHTLSHQRTRVAAADARGALSPRVPAAPQLCSRSRTAQWLAALRAPGRGARADHDRARDDRRARPQLAPFDQELRAYARQQPGCRALIEQIYGVGELTAVTILAELGDARRFSQLPRRRPLRRPGHHRPPIRPAPRARAPLPPRTARAALGAIRGRPSRRAARAAPTAPTTSSSPSGSAATARASRSRASCSNAATTSSESSATRRSRPREAPRARQARRHRCTAASSRHACCRHVRVDGPKDRAAATLHPAGTIAVGTPVARRPPHRSQRAR